MEAVASENRIMDAFTQRNESAVQMQLNIDGFNQMFYRGQFRELLAAASAIDLNRIALVSLVDLALLRANALFELGDVNACRQVMEVVLTETAVRFPKQYTYVSARLRYMSGEYAQAQELFEVLKQISNDDGDVGMAFKAELGLANIAYTQHNAVLLATIIESLSASESKVGISEQLSLLLLRGHLAGFVPENAGAADHFFKAALNQATRQGWAYFQKRALYFMIVTARRSNNESLATARFEILDSMIDESQDRYFLRLVRERFQAGTDFNQPMRVDPQAMAVSFGGKSMWNLHDCPQMFRFVELLHNTQRFVTKAEVARALWPHENYRKYMHDPRIFDLAKRLRKRIDGESLQGISFLSGRAGYQLVMPKAS